MVGMIECIPGGLTILVFKLDICEPNYLTNQKSLSGNVLDSCMIDVSSFNVVLRLLIGMQLNMLNGCLTYILAF